MNAMSSAATAYTYTHALARPPTGSKMIHSECKRFTHCAGMHGNKQITVHGEANNEPTTQLQRTKCPENPMAHIKIIALLLCLH